MASFVAVLVVAVVSFLLGSIPWGVVFSKLLFREDVRDHGSGNIGTTNMMRTYGKKVGIVVFILDFAKGVASGLVALQVLSFCVNGGYLEGVDAQWFRGALLGLSFLACICGHVFSPWLQYKGGKGIAVAIGCLYVAFGPLVATLQLMVFIVLVPTTKYVSVGSIASALTCPFFSLYVFWGNWTAVLLCTAGAMIVFWAHRGNLQRLMSGTERRIGKKKEE